MKDAASLARGREQSIVDELVARRPCLCALAHREILRTSHQNVRRRSAKSGAFYVRAMFKTRTFIVLVGLLSAAMLAAGVRFGAPIAAASAIPKVWDETALADWATPVAGLNVRPTNMSAGDYYAMSV